MEQLKIGFLHAHWLIQEPGTCQQIVNILLFYYYWCKISSRNVDVKTIEVPGHFRFTVPE